MPTSRSVPGITALFACWSSGLPTLTAGAVIKPKFDLGHALSLVLDGVTLRWIARFRHVFGESVECCTYVFSALVHGSGEICPKALRASAK